MKIAVGGMIASGKSTLVKSLGVKLNMPLLEEFRADDEVFNSLLTWLYEKKPDVEMLLQVYFIHNHYTMQMETKGDFIVDRDLIEHWLFAHKNLAKMPRVMNMYNGLFMSYMNDIKKPDLYIILDINIDEFLKRIKKRGRASEVDNLDSNLDYFKNLLSDYVELLTAQCKIYNIPYEVIKVDGKNKDEVLEEALMICQNFMQGM